MENRNCIRIVALAHDDLAVQTLQMIASSKVCPSADKRAHYRNERHAVQVAGKPEWDVKVTTHKGNGSSERSVTCIICPGSSFPDGTDIAIYSVYGFPNSEWLFTTRVTKAQQRCLSGIISTASKAGMFYALNRRAPFGRVVHQAANEIVAAISKQE